MLFGEFELSDLFWSETTDEPQAPFFWVSIAMVYLYMIVMCAAVMNTFISIAVDNISDYQNNAVLKDQLSALQEYDTPTLVSKMVSPVVERYFRKDRDTICYRVISRIVYFLVPTALFHDQESMHIRLSQQEFSDIMNKHQYMYELDTLENRQKVSDLIKKMKTKTRDSS
eukprot:GFUD01082333.1.p1 GENE.GFUD01082333.1~~GFUD01082333.1.p1  ORF type:complete len:190 (+),score=25.41 GFUD01082333.1:63-572(+)